MIKALYLVTSIILSITLTACSNSSDSDNLSEPSSIASGNSVGSQSPAPGPEAPADFELLFVGNSHVAQNALPNMVASMIEQGTTKTAYVYRDTSAMFLDERDFRGTTYDKIKARNWTHVILQGQKYSTTGLYFYPTDATEEWIRIIKAQNTVPVLFPEHPREGNFEEGQRVHNLHVEIAQRESACIAPIGLAWDLSRERHPEISLHSDGNHANLYGTLLTAFVFYEVTTGQAANQLAFIESIQINSSAQAILREIASETILLNPPCTMYP